MKLYDTLEKQLKKETNFVTDAGELKKWVVINKAQNFDGELIELLLDNAEIKDAFFMEVKGALVFNQPKFLQFLEQKNYLNDSYTKFRNKVGLTIDGKYLGQRNEVALVWPFKDCILEGGQSREEDKREEIFFNEVLAQDEITQLLEPKVLTNAKVYDATGEREFEGFNRDAEINFARGLPESTITDNLLVKGNNLLGLTSLKEEFGGKVKMIYIDPPYNTLSDSFRYNDRFSHSTWLTFMKNRLQIAKDLLKTDGTIFINVDEKEQAYLKCLCDEIFGRDNFLNIFSIKTSDPSGHKTVNPSPYAQTEFLLLYARDKKAYTYDQKYVQGEYDSGYNQFILNIDEDYSKWSWVNINDHLAKESGFKDTRDANKKLGKSIFKGMVADFALKNSHRVFQATAIADDAAKEIVKVRDKSKLPKNKGMVFKVEGREDEIFVKDGRQIYFYKSKIRDVDGKLVPTKPLTNLWADIPYNGISKEGGVSLKNGKKPEKLLRRIIEISSEPHDLVVDFHVGSGTTAAVAHKLDRQYIGIEQLDYDKNDSSVRLQNVIAGEQSGVSKIVKWKGGGSFTYFELKKYNQTFINQIAAAKDSKELMKIWDAMKALSFLNYNVELKEQDEDIEAFKGLDFEEQKVLLVSLLDKNQLYVNLSSLDDKDFACTDEEKKVTRAFYKLNA